MGEGHLGQSCFRTRVCGLDGCQEVHHRLLHKHAVDKNTGVLISRYQQSKGVNVDKNGAQQQKSTNTNQGILSSKGDVSPIEGENADRNVDTTMVAEASKRMGNVALRTVSVYLRNGDRKLKINALLDDASTKTYVCQCGCCCRIGFTR